MPKTKIYFEQIPVKVVKKILAAAIREKQKKEETSAVSPARKQEARV